MGFFKDMLSKLSTGEQKASKEFELIGNCFGFYGVDGGVGTSTLAFEIANIVSQQNIHTCFIDCSPLSSFAFSKVTKHIENKDEIPSIGNRFVKRTCPISNTLISVNETLKVMTFGDLPLSDTFSMNYDVVYETYKEAKEVFDLVIMDIQNLPWCESTIAAVQNCSTVYTICAPTPETIIKKAQLNNLMSLAGIDSAFRNIIFGGVPADISVTSSLGKMIQGNIIGEYPYVPDFKKVNISNTSVIPNSKSHELKNYAAFTDVIITEMLEGISGKEVEN